MNREQATHAKSIANKIIPHLESALSIMSSIGTSTVRQISTLPASQVKDKFTHDSGYGLLDYLDAIEDVLKDMLKDLDEH